MGSQKHLFPFYRCIVVLDLTSVTISLLSCKKTTQDELSGGSRTTAKRAASQAKMDTQSIQNHEHDPTNPPIDCPLRKQGIYTHRLKPFDDVEKYIAFLERSDRAVWQKPDEAVKTLALVGAETVVDLGAGSGYFTFHLAKAVPRGKVVALDIEPEMIRHIHHRAMNTGVTNVEVSLARPEDPGVPRDVDLVFMCDVLHHVKNKSAWLTKLFSEMKSGAKLVLIEFKEGDLPEGPPEKLKISSSELIAMVTKSGFIKYSEHIALLPYQTFFVFRKP